MEKKKKNQCNCSARSREELTAKRVLIYTAGILLVSLGIVLCKKCDMGISPISSIPFVLADIVPLTFGTLTALFHFVNIVLQMVLARKIGDTKIWLQVPLAFVFGWVIDGFNQCIMIDSRMIIYKILALVFSIFFTALGMVCMLDMNLIQNPPDGTVKQISTLSGWEFAAVKIGYDVTCVLASVLLSIVFLHRVEGFGIATIASAIFVGKTIRWIRIVRGTYGKLKILLQKG